MAEYVETSEQFIEVDADKCTGCGRCIEVCANDTFKLENGKAVMVKLEGDYECFACYLVCAPGAIKFKIPKAGTGIIYKYG